MKRIILFLFLSISAFSFSHAQETSLENTANRSIPFQGRLDSEGEPAEGTFSMRFSLENGSETWSERHSVLVSNGLFFIVLGNNNPIPKVFFEVQELEVGIEIEGESKIKIPILPTPQSRYAFDVADGILTPSHFISALPNQMLATDGLGKPYWTNTPQASVSTVFGGNINVAGNTILGTEESSTTQVTGALQLTDFITQTGGAYSGMMRFNTQKNVVQVFTNQQWYDVSLDSLNFNTLGISSQSETLIQGGLILGKFDGDADKGMVRYQNNILEIYDGSKWYNVGNLVDAGSGLTKDESTLPALQLGGKLLKTTKLETATEIDLEVTGNGEFKVEGNTTLGFLTTNQTQINGDLQVQNNTKLGFYSTNVTEVAGTLKLGNYTGTTVQDGMMRYTGSVFQIRQLGVWETLATTSGSWDLGGNGSTNASSFIGTSSTNPLNFGVNSQFFMSATTTNLGVSHPVFAHNSLTVNEGLILQNASTNIEGKLRFDGTKFEGYSNGVWQEFITINNNSGGLLQTGNTFGTATVIGSNDNYNLVLKSNNQEFVKLTPQGQFFLSDAHASTLIGEGVGTSSTTNAHNVFLGKGAGNRSTTSFSNTFLGTGSGAFHQDGSGNVFVGIGSGANNISGIGNIFIGNNAGTNETGSQKLYIENSSSNTPLIYGDFTDDFVSINGNLIVGKSASTTVRDGMLRFQNGNFQGYANNNWNDFITTAGLNNLGWKINGNSNMNSANFIGTTDTNPLIFKVNSSIFMSATTSKLDIYLPSEIQNSLEIKNALTAKEGIILEDAGVDSEGKIRFNGNKFQGFSNGTWQEFITTNSTSGGILQGGNAFGTAMHIGTTDTNPFIFKVNSSTFMSATTSKLDIYLPSEIQNSLEIKNALTAKEGIILEDAGADSEGKIRFNGTKFQGFSNGTWQEFITTNSTSGGILQGGNAFGTSMTIGANDNNHLILKANTAQATFTTNGMLDISSTGGSTIIGTSAGQNNTGGSNVFLGQSSGFNNISGIENVYLGGFAGYGFKGSSNTLIGYASGSGGASLLGNNNVFVGRGTGSGNTGSGNIFLGYLAGDHNDFRTKSNQLIISNTLTNNPLIYGDFSSSTLQINGLLQVGNESVNTTQGLIKVSQKDGATNRSWIFGIGDGSNFGHPDNFGIRDASGNMTLMVMQRNGLGGNIGIGTATPTEKLEVNGAIKIGNNTTSNAGTIRYNSGKFAGHNGNWVNFIQSNKYYEDANNLFIGNRTADTGNNNTFIGVNAGLNHSSANENVFIGTDAGVDNTSGRNHVIIGSQAGKKNSGFSNVFIGYSAAKDNTGNYNVAIGTATMSKAAGGSSNVMIGHNSGQDNQAGGNVFLGYQTGKNNTGSNNVFLGKALVSSTGSALAGVSNKLAIDNSNTDNPLIYGDFTNNKELVKINGVLQITNSTSITASAGMIRYNGTKLQYHNGSAWKDFMIEGEPGGNATTMDGQSFIGGGQLHTASGLRSFIGSGDGNTASGQLAVVVGGNANTAGYRAFVGGGTLNKATGNYSCTPGGYNNIASGNHSFAFGNGARANGNNAVAIGSNAVAATNQIVMKGTAGCRIFTDAGSTLGVNLPGNGSTWGTISDRRRKKDIQNLKDPLKNVLALRGASFIYKSDSTNRKQIGFIAQEVEKVYPEMVYKDAKGIKSVTYSNFTAVLVEAVKEQQQQIEVLKRQVQSLKVENTNLKAKVDSITKLESNFEQLSQIVEQLQSSNTNLSER